MAPRASCDVIISRIRHKGEGIDSIKGDVKKCFIVLIKENDGKQLSFDFGLRCLTTIATLTSKRKSEWTTDDWSVSEVVSLLSECHDNLAKSSSSSDNAAVSRCLYNVFINLLDLDFIQAMIVSNRLLTNLTEPSNSSEHVGPIARNCYVKLWNAAILVEKSPHEALKRRLESLRYLILSPSEASKFCSNAVHTAQVYSSSGNGHAELDDFTARILDLFRERLIDVAITTDALCYDIVRLVRMTLQLLLKQDRSDCALKLVERARRAFDRVTRQNRTLVLFELDVFDLLVELSCSLSAKRGSSLNKIAELFTSCIEYLDNDGVVMTEKQLVLSVYMVKIELRSIAERVAVEATISLAILPCIRQFSRFVRSMALGIKHISVDDSLYLCNLMLLFHSYGLKAFVENTEAMLETVDDAVNVIKVYASIVMKLATEKFLDAILLFLSSSYTMVLFLCQKKLFAECLSFIHPYFGYLLRSYGYKDETKIQFWKRMNALVFCLNRAGKFHEALQVVAEFLAKDLGQDDEAMALWVSVKREVIRENVTALKGVTTKSLVAVLLRSSDEAKRIRLVSLLKQELEALKAETYPVDEGVHQVLCDLIELTADPIETSTALIQMARFLLCHEPDYDRKRNPTKCCRQALKILEKSKLSKKTVFVFGSAEDLLAVQAQFVLYLAGMQERYSVLNEKVGKQEQKLSELRKKRRADAEKGNPAAGEKNDGDEFDDYGVATYQLSTLHEELQVLTELDSCVSLWRSILEASSEVTPYAVDVLQDLRCAAEIFASARFFSQEVAAWELFLKLAKTSERWLDYADGISRFSTTLTRLGLTKRAETLLEEAAACTQRLSRVDPEVANLVISLQLARSELYLMKNNVDVGWEQLCSAKRSIKDAKRTKSVVFLESIAFALESKYCELPRSARIGRTEREITPVEATSDALRLCSSLLRLSSEDGLRLTMLFKQRLLANLMDCSHRLGQLHYNFGSPRNARCYLIEELAWCRRFFFVNRTVEVMLLLSRVDLLAEEISKCQVKLNGVQHIMDSTDISFLSFEKSLPDDAEKKDDGNDDCFIIISPVQSERILSIPLTMSSTTSPCPSGKRAVPPLNEHEIKCKCSRCRHIVVHQLRAESLFVRHELLGMPYDSTEKVLQLAKRFSQIEKALVAKIGKERAVSYIEIRSCWMLARIAEKQLGEGDTKEALITVTAAMSKFASFRWIGIGQLHFLEATLKYHKCVAQLHIHSRREGKHSISQLCDAVWATSGHDTDVSISSDVDGLTVGIADMDISRPTSDFKTPRHKPISSRLQKRHIRNKAGPILDLTDTMGSSTSKKKRVRFGLDAAPKKTKPPMSIFQNTFSPEESDSDDNVAGKKQNVTIEISDDDDLMVFDPVENPESEKKWHKKSSKAVVNRFQSSIIPDKENSDTEDFSPVKSLRRHGPRLDSVLDIVKVDFNASPAKNLQTPKRESSPIVTKGSFTVERIRDEETGCGKNNGTTTGQMIGGRKALNLTIRMAPRPATDVVGRRTRSKSALTVEEEEAEINRGESPKKKSKIVAREPAVRHILKSESDLDFAIEMNDVISTLDTAVGCVEHHPQVPLYGDLNLLLALCKGERSVSSVGHVLESVSITLRHYACGRLGSTLRSLATDRTTDSEDVTSNVEARHRFLNFREGSLQFKGGNDIGALKLVTDKLPKDWVVCQINALPDVLTGNSKNPELFVTRLQHDQKPIVAKIACPKSTQGARDFLSEFNNIMSEMKLSVRVTDAKTWWTVRKNLDARLQTLLQSMEDVWLGSWKCLLLGRPQQEIDQKKLRETTKQLLSDIALLKLHSVNEQLLELVLDCWPWLKSAHLNIALSRACGLSVTDLRLRKISALVHDRSAGLWSIGVTRKVVILILDKTVHCLPWESLPILRANPASRMPSVHFLLGHLAIHLPPFGHSDRLNVPIVDVSPTSTFYVLNPSGDLIRTENYLKDVFHKELNWHGVVGRPPTKEEWTDALSAKDLFFYCGHGAGAKYAAGEVIEKKFCRATTILMGCSSACIKNQGRNLEAHGIILQYLIAGCPSVVGNLWDVTDKDIDKLTAALLRNWIPGPNQRDCCLLHSLPLARQVTILGYLVGSAPVTYGIPVYAKPIS